MKKLFLTLFYLSFTFGFAQEVTVSKGSGTIHDPYQIASLENLGAGVTITSNATNNTICSGASVTFTATPSGTGATNYQWKKNGIAISGATNSTYTTSDLANGDAISVQLSVNSGTIFTTNSVMHLDAGNPSSYPGTGSTWTDLSGNNNNAPLPSALVSSYSSTIGLGSFNFQANSAYAIQSSAMNNWNITTTNALSVETWIKRTNYGNYQFWFSTPDLYYRLGVNPSGYLFWDMGQYRDRSPGILVSENVWHHIVYTAGKESGNITTRAYLDGILVATQNEGITALSPFTNYLIGDGQTPGWHPLNGNMGLIRVFNSTLTAANVLQNYNAEVDRFTNGLFISNTITTTVNPIPVPVIDGLSTASSGQTNVQYTTTASMTNYNWSVTGGTATAGGGMANNTITITWGANGTGHVKVNYTNSGNCTAAAQTDFPVSILTKTSLQTGSWNDAATWIPTGVPTITENVIIMHAVTVTNSPTAICNSLTISSGSVMINAGQALTVNGTLTNSVGINGLFVNSGGSLIESSGAEATVESVITDSEWHLISVPVSGGTAEVFTGKYLQKHSESTNSYSDITRTTDLLTAGKGYAIYGGSGFTARYTGSLNTGVKLSNWLTRSAAGNTRGYNLVGNPYPSFIDWQAAGGWTKTNVNNATYLHVNASTWATFVDGTGVNGGSRYIAPGQGFFVVVTDNGSTTGTLGMTNSVRVQNATAFLKSNDLVPNLVRLQVSGNGYSDETVVRFLSESTAGFDDNYDAYKLYGDVAEAPQIYTFAGTELAINSLPETDVVPVGVKIGTSGAYSISGTESNDLKYATLEDTKTGIFTELANNAYTFNFDKNENELRFKLHFGMLDVKDNKSVAAIIYSYRKTVYISLTEQIKCDIYIYNIAGQLVATELSVKGMNEISLNKTGNYIVKIVTDKAILVKKIFIQQ